MRFSPLFGPGDPVALVFHENPHLLRHGETTKEAHVGVVFGLGLVGSCFDRNVEAVLARPLNFLRRGAGIFGRGNGIDGCLSKATFERKQGGKLVNSRKKNAQLSHS